MLLILMSMACISAEDNSTEVVEASIEDVVSVNQTAGDDIVHKDINVSFTTNDSTVINGNYFSVKLEDENHTGISNKPVYFNLNKNTTAVNTTSEGIAKLFINETPGTYTVKYSFKESGYVKTTKSSDILVLNSKKSKIIADDYTAYYGFDNKFVIILKASGVRLANREVSFTVNGKTYKNRTNSNGKAYFAIGLRKGTYGVSFAFAGEKNIKASNGTAVIKVKKMPVEFKRANDVIFRHKTLNKFKVKLVDNRGNPVKNAKVKFIFNKKAYVRYANSKGVVSVGVNLSKGAYDFKFKFAETSKYKKTSKTFKVKVKSKKVKNNGLWLYAYDMPNVNFNSLKNLGTKHIFLNFFSVEKYGKSYVEKFIKNAKDKGIKVHIWMQVFYKSGKWYYPVKKGKLNYDLINKKVKEAKKYAKLKGVAGVHFDYIRFPGNAYKYENAVKAVNYFTKKASNAVHKINSKLVVSAAIMPELSSLKKYYAQDIPTMSKYLDAIVPMVYKGNYHAGYSWVYSVTKQIVKMSKGAQIWTGLQTYRSDEDLTLVPNSELTNDADYAGFAGAKGVILFRFGLINGFDFTKL